MGNSIMSNDSERYYTGIGSRKTPDHIKKLMSIIAMECYRDGLHLRTGDALGADYAFVQGYANITGTFNHPKSKKYTVYSADSVDINLHEHLWAYATVDTYHPAPSKLSNYSRDLMARNAMQVLGENGDSPCEFVICWTPNGSRSGGTGQALRIAEAYNIPIYDLGLKDVYEFCYTWFKL